VNALARARGPVPHRSMALRDLRDDVQLMARRAEHAPAHYHGCPSCYEPEACLLDCTIEPDLGEHKGCGIGGYAVCSTCTKAGAR
jgi:hypothetical protein